MRILRQMCDHTIKYRIQNDVILKIDVTSIGKKVTINQLKYFEYVQKRPQGMSLKRVNCIIFST